MEQKPTPLRLVNPHQPTTESTKVTSLLINPIWNYFFRHVLAGHRGAQQILIASFFQKLYDECRKRNVAACYDPDNEQLIAGLLNDLNFRPEPESAIEHRATTPRRRATTGTPKPKRKPASGDSHAPAA